MPAIWLRIEPELCGPVSVGTVSVIKLISRHGELDLARAMSLVDRCVFDGEAMRVAMPSRAAAEAFVQALAELPPVPRVSAQIIED